MAKVSNTQYRFEARWGNEALDCGIDTIPHVIVKHMGELGLSNAKFALTVQAFSFKWTGDNPYPSAATLADRMGTTVGTVHNISRSLEKMTFTDADGNERSYLVRKCLDAEKGIWSWDFSGLLERALQLERGELSTPQKGGAPIDAGGATSISAGGATPISAPKTEAVQSEEFETETTSQPLGDLPPMGMTSDAEGVVVDCNTSLLNDLLCEGMTRKQAVLLMDGYDHNAIEEALECVGQGNGTITNHAGFIMDAVRKGWDLTIPTGTNGATYTPPPDLWRGFEPLSDQEQREYRQAGRVAIQSMKEILTSLGFGGNEGSGGGLDTGK